MTSVLTGLVDLTSTQTLYERIVECKDSDFPRSEYYWSRSITAYVRTGPMFNRTHSAMCRGVTIANIQVLECRRGKGVFKAFLKEVEGHARANDLSCVVVECVSNELLLGHLLKNGYTVDHDEGSPTVYKHLHGGFK